MLEEFLLIFIPMFVVIDPFGVMPIYLVMTSSMDIGSEFFEEFKKGCGELLAAVEQGDLEASIKAAGNVNQMRKDCHGRFKSI